MIYLSTLTLICYIRPHFVGVIAYKYLKIGEHEQFFKNILEDFKFILAHR
jgi:hypothetical protein